MSVEVSDAPVHAKEEIEGVIAAFNEAVSGKTINWLGRADVQREYVYVPDAMRIAVEIGARNEALGEHWCLPGSGPLSGRQAADIAGRLLGRHVKLRPAGRCCASSACSTRICAGWGFIFRMRCSF
jgi:nucleoside-diphosphate-sugar epimerase